MFEFKNTLIIAAHPDDEVLGVGGVVPLIKSGGGRVTVLVVTDGSTSQYKGDSEILARKRSQMIEANRIMGTADLTQWEYPDMKLDSIDHATLTSQLGEFIEFGGYDTIFFHAKNDINLDHRIIHQAVLVAARPLTTNCVNNLLCYYVNSSTEWGGRSQDSLFLPNFYIDISKTLEIKLNALAAYVDELRDFPHPRSIEAVRNRASVFGSEAGYEAADAFNYIFRRHPN
jgi:LmbE family N-acetylglucosaminyl deacetylase